MMKILLIGHACGPNRGSEPGNTWNLSWGLSEHHEVWVLTHPQHRQETEDDLRQKPNERLHFLYITPSAKLDPWDPAKGERGLRAHYLLWQRAVRDKVLELCRTVKPDLVHHFSLGTIKAPPRLHDVPLPVVWGPMGGGQTMPTAFWRYFRGQLVSEYARIALAKATPILPAVRRMARRAQVALANNQETLELLRAAGAPHAELALETAVASSSIDGAVDVAANNGHSSELSVLWAGRLETRKALLLGLEAMAKVRAPVTLRIAGDGHQMQMLEGRARELNLTDRVKFLGRVPHPEMASLFRQSDVLLFTSLRDSTGAIVLEAMGKGLAIVTLDHQGVRTMVPPDAGIKVPVTRPDETVAAVASALDRLANSPQARRQMRAASLRCARENTWEARVRQIVGFYEVAIERFRSSPC